MNKRKLISFGIFSREIVQGKRIRDKCMLSVYRKLLDLGFKQTRWQYIFDGQIGGLVLPFNGGENEVHVRFYNNRIFAEYEIGRAYVTHFIGPRFNANNYLLGILYHSLSQEEVNFLEEFCSAKRQVHEESQMINWDNNSSEDIFKKQKKYERNIIASVAIAGVLDGGWKIIGYLLVLLLSAFALSHGIIYFLGSLLLYPAIAKLPSIGKP